MKILKLTDWKSWATIFTIGVILGAIFCEQIGAIIAPLVLPIADNVNSTMDEKQLSSSSLFIFYILKNSIIALICLLTARITLGIYPLLILMVYSLFIGCLAGLFKNFQEISYLAFTVAIAPHGFIEIFSICLTCAIGMYSLKIHEKLKMFTLPLGLLVIAAAIEVYISPLVVAKFL